MMRVFDFYSLLRYLLEGIGVALATYLVSGRKLDFQEIAMVAGTAAATLFVLDNLAPGVSMGARQGTGFGLGLQTVGSPIPLEGFEGEAGEAEVSVEGEVSGEGSVESDEHYGKDCRCGTPCSYTCQVGDGCPVNCPDTTTVPPAPPACQDGCNITVSGCPYKLVPGYYSHRVLLPGYNECVQPYNSIELDQTLPVQAS